jgi:hypothetical protein
MKTRAGMYIAFLAGLLWACELFAADTYGGKNDQAQQAAASSDTAIVFYGKVIDQYGQPVAKAKITGGKEYFSTHSVRFFGVETVKAETDVAGNFIFTGLLVKKLYIRSIEKRCYEAAPESCTRSYSYDEGNDGPLFKPAPDKPVVFVLNKKCDPGLVANKKCRMLLRPIWEGFTVDLFNGFSDPLTKISKGGTGPDIRVSIVQSQNQDYYEMEIAAPGENNGLAEKDDGPHVAPARGYLPALAYTFNKGPEAKAVLYHKGRGGKVYSRLEITLSPVSEGIRVTCELFTNIEGLHNTDFDRLYTEEEIGRIMGKRLSYGARGYREAVTGILQNTIQKKP